MKIGYRAAAAIIALASLWLIAMSLLSVFGNGTFYHVTQPVSVLASDADSVTVRVERTSLRDMPAMCARELECDGRVYQFTDRPCPVEAGRATFTVVMAIPDDASGRCIYRGIITYRPVGVFGPDMFYAWRTESFEVKEVIP